MVTQGLLNSCPAVKSFLLCDRVPVFHSAVPPRFRSGELLSSPRTSLLLPGEPDAHNITGHVTRIPNYDLVIHRGVTVCRLLQQICVTDVSAPLIHFPFFFFCSFCNRFMTSEIGLWVETPSVLQTVARCLPVAYRPPHPLIRFSNKSGGGVQSYAPHPALLFHL